MAKTIEQQVADAILERDATTITIDGELYKVGSPSIATLILVSELVSTLPIVSKDVDKDKILAEVLRNARHYRALGDIAATLILGAKNLTEEVETTTTRRFFFGLLRRKVRRVQIIDRKAQLAEKVLKNVTPAVLFDLLIMRLNRLDIGNFFAITTSLSEANILKPTRGVEQ